MTVSFSIFLKAIVAFAAIAVSVSAQAQNAERLLENDLKPAILTMERDIHLYHYFIHKDVWPELKTAEGRAEHLNRYVEAVGGRFWDLKYSANAYINAGPGLYLATDPHTSLEFGQGRDPKDFAALIEMPVLAGTKWLNVQPHIKISDATIKAIVDENLLTHAEVSRLFTKEVKKKDVVVERIYPVFYRDTLMHMSQENLANFRLLVHRILIRNNIQIIGYNWRTSATGLCPHFSNFFLAFNYIGKPHPANANPTRERPWPRAELEPQYTNMVTLTEPTMERNGMTELPGLSQRELEMAPRVKKLRSFLDGHFAMIEKKQKVPADYVSQFYSAEELKEVKSKLFTCTAPAKAVKQPAKNPAKTPAKASAQPKKK